MKQVCCLTAVLLLTALFPACQPDPAAKLRELEAKLLLSGSAGEADTLSRIYQNVVRLYPDNPELNIHYLTRAGELLYEYKEDDLNSVRLANKAIKEYGKGHNLTEPIGLLARVGNAYLYHKTPNLSGNPDDLDEMHDNLQNNMVWIDSSLVRLEREMGSPVVTDKAKAEHFIQISETYAELLDSTKRDKKVDLFMMAGALAKSTNNPNKALQLYYNVGEKMPNHPKAPTALFMEAFIYENDLHDIEKAKSTYEMFLQRYPDDPDYADDAQNSLKLLGKSAEEIIKEFEQNPQ